MELLAYCVYCSGPVTCRYMEIVYNVAYPFDAQTIPDSKVDGANMRPIWVLSAPDDPHVGPMNLAILDSSVRQ